MLVGFYWFGRRVNRFENDREEQRVIDRQLQVKYKNWDENTYKSKGRVNFFDISFVIPDQWTVLSKKETENEVVLTLKSPNGQEVLMEVGEFGDLTDVGSGRSFLGKTKFGGGDRYSLVTTEGVSRDAIVFPGYPVLNQQGEFIGTIEKYYEISFTPDRGFEKEIQEIIDSAYPSWRME